MVAQGENWPDSTNIYQYHYRFLKIRPIFPRSIFFVKSKLAFDLRFHVATQNVPHQSKMRHLILIQNIQWPEETWQLANRGTSVLVDN